MSELETPEEIAPAPAESERVFELTDVEMDYGGEPVVEIDSLYIAQMGTTAIIGASGCGKSTLLRSFNRMNEISASSFSLEGEVLYRGVDIYDKQVDPVALRRHIGMVFQKPNPFPKSIFENVAFGVVNLGREPGESRKGLKIRTEETVERSLRAASLWDEVKDHLDDSAYALSGGQQQRLCIARALAVDPDVLLLDEPCSALDPIATASVEQTIEELSESVKILIVTHNMQQASRLGSIAGSDTIFMSNAYPLDNGTYERGAGRIVEHNESKVLFETPENPQTEAYITGHIG